MLRILESSSRADQNRVLLMEDSIRPGKLLYRWEDYTEYLQPLAFAVRMKIMLAGPTALSILSKHGKTTSLSHLALLMDIISRISTLN
jgi:hypothetical protein